MGCRTRKGQSNCQAGNSPTRLPGPNSEPLLKLTQTANPNAIQTIETLKVTVVLRAHQKSAKLPRGRSSKGEPPRAVLHQLRLAPPCLQPGHRARRGGSARWHPHLPLPPQGSTCRARGGGSQGNRLGPLLPSLRASRVTARYGHATTRSCWEYKLRAQLDVKPEPCHRLPERSSGSTAARLSLTRADTVGRRSEHAASPPSGRPSFGWDANAAVVARFKSCSAPALPTSSTYKLIS